MVDNATVSNFNVPFCCTYFERLKPNIVVAAFQCMRNEQHFSSLLGSPLKYKSGKSATKKHAVAHGGHVVRSS